MALPLLDGTIGKAPTLEASIPDITLASAEDVEMLRAQLSEMQEELNAIKGILLRQYGAFKTAFGDQAITTSDSSDKWTAIKSRMAPRLREAIDLLLLQGSMKRTQIASALKMDYSNCTKNVISVLKAQGWIVEQNGSLSLKQL
jgi:hypothetical protein